MTKRDIFSELQEGMNAWSEFNEGKKTLKTHRINVKPLSMTSAEVKAVREKLNLSQAVLLLKMVEKRPDTLIELAGL